jgi:hypothetical protein
MAIKPVDEHAGETVAGPEPKYLMLKNGVLTPYNANMARHRANGEEDDARQAVPLAAMPAAYAEKLKQQVAVRAAQEQAQLEMRERIAAEQDLRAMRGRRGLKQDQAAITVGAAEKQAQGTLDAKPKAGDFVISTASVAELVAFARRQFGVDLDPTVKPALLRVEVARLTGLAKS